MFNQSVRSFTKQALQWSRVKLVYERVTLTRFTSLYFFLALINCIVLVVLQSIAFVDNAEASGTITGFLTQANITKNRLVYLSGDTLFTCSDLPSQADAHCEAIVSTSGGDDDDDGHEDHESRRSLNGLMLNSRGDIVQRHPEVMKNSSGQIQGLRLDDGQVLNQHCLQSLVWLNESIRDSMSEDVVTLVFQIWLFLLSFVTILNESLPHLGAALAGHCLATTWSGYRIENSHKLQSHYDTLIVGQTCDNVDFLGGWWELRMQHTIPILVANVIIFMLTTYLSFKLYKVYLRQSLNRVGASPQIHKIYKLVLALSVCLQLAGFFTIAQTAMWLDKASQGTIRYVAKHLTLYRAVFCVMAVLEIPWVTLGWLSVRRENRVQFTIFLGISLALLASSSAIFASPLYTFIFHMWPFFATITITSYLLIVIITALGIACRLQFGKGLPAFLKETEALEGADFAPVYVPELLATSGKRSFDSEKGFGPGEARFETLPRVPPVEMPPPARFSFHARAKTSSVYSDIGRDTLKLSSTPPLVQSLLSSSKPQLAIVTEHMENQRNNSPSPSRGRVGLPSNPRPTRSPKSSTPANGGTYTYF